MRYKSIGSDRQSVSAIGVGMGLDANPNRDPAHEEYAEVLRLAFDLGMTFVDTAEIYGAGQSEEVVGRAIKGRRDEIYLATKVSPKHLGRDALIRAADRSLSRLGVSEIDLLQTHWPNPQIPINETMAGLDALMQAGKVRHIGLGNVSRKELDEAEACLGKDSIASVQVEYNLFDRSIEEDLLPYCQARGTAVIAYSPLDQGMLCGNPGGRDKLAQIARHYDCTAAQVALAWLIGQDGVFATPKARQPDHVRQNVAAAAIDLSDDHVEEIRRSTAPRKVDVPVVKIRVVPDDAPYRQVYRTLDEARRNIYGLTPSPADLATALRNGDFLKPVRVRPSAQPNDCDYELVEGRVRYWAWVIAFEGKRDIPVLVRE